MARYSLIVFTFLLPLLSWGQIEITGRVFEKSTKESLIGVTILEKGTQNGTVSDIEGNFSLTVKNENALLEIWYTGYATKIIEVKESNYVEAYLEVFLEEECIKCWFDQQHIGLFLQAGLINYPIGGAFMISSPYLPGGSTLEGNISYQTNKDKAYLFSSSLRLLHIISSCSFDADLSASYKKLNANEQFDFDSYTIEANLNWRRFRPIIGISKLNFDDKEATSLQTSVGPLLGFRTIIGRPFWISAIGKVSLYNGIKGYQVEANRNFRAVKVFLRYEQLDDFTEVSLGVGYEHVYLLKRNR